MSQTIVTTPKHLLLTMAGHFSSGPPDKISLHDQNMNNHPPSKQTPSPGDKESVFFLSSPEAIPSPISGSPILQHHPITPPLLQKIQSTSPQKSPSIPHKNMKPPLQSQPHVPLSVPGKPEEKLVPQIANGGQRSCVQPPSENPPKKPALDEKQRKTEEDKCSVIRAQSDTENGKNSGNKVVKQSKTVSMATIEKNGGDGVKEEGTESASDSER